jgi:tether containing UBX domain for GLUT4
MVLLPAFCAIDSLADISAGPDYPAPLAESVLARAEDLPKPPQEVVSNESDSKGKGKAPQTLGGGPVPPDTEKKFPKWFKIGSEYRT